jgi:hypothetical protein
MGLEERHAIIAGFPSAHSCASSLGGCGSRRDRPVRWTRFRPELNPRPSNTARYRQSSPVTVSRTASKSPGTAFPTRCCMAETIRPLFRRNKVEVLTDDIENSGSGALRLPRGSSIDPQLGRRSTGVLHLMRALFRAANRRQFLETVPRTKTPMRK